MLCAGDADELASSKDTTWPRAVPPRKKKEKDVFKFLKEQNVNYTVRRQEFQLNRIMEKTKKVKEVREG